MTDENPPASVDSGEVRNPLADEILFYLDSLPHWSEWEGQHVLIKGSACVGVFPDRDAALTEGFRRFGHVSFLVKQVQIAEQPRFLGENRVYSPEM